MTPTTGERKRLVIKQLGADLRLSGRTIVFTPVKYLVPIAENHETLEAKKEAARTAPEQIKKDLKEGLNEVWLGLQDSNLRMTGPKPVALPLGEGPTCELFYHKNTL